MSKTEFNAEQFLSIYPLGIEKHYWTRARNFIIEKELKKSHLRNKKLLEIGCGRGIVVNFLRERGIDCYGVDLAPVDEIFRISQYIFPDRDFEDLSVDFRNSIEVILLLDVIEHIPDEIVFLKRIKVNFPNAKYLLITVPARMELWSNYDEYNGHYRRYNIENIEPVMKNGNWEMLRLQYIFHSLYLPALLLIQTVKDRRTQITPPQGIFIFFHFMFSWFFLFEYILVFKKLVGTSIIGVFHVISEK